MIKPWQIDVAKGVGLIAFGFLMWSAGWTPSLLFVAAALVVQLLSRIYMRQYIQTVAQHFADALIERQIHDRAMRQARKDYGDAGLTRDWMN